ncbi:MAG: response regulator [Anaerolineae bacterium]|nr:response regulator [Anaerolineae bacterium]
MGYILFVEDNQSNADMTIRILASAGYEVKHVLRGFEGAQLARKERPSLILMDFDLPDINGQTLTLLLKKQLGGVHAPPIIAVTARSGDAEVRIAANFGCSAFISKPFLPEDLLSVVQKLMPSEKPPQPQLSVPPSSPPSPQSSDDTLPRRPTAAPSMPDAPAVPAAPTPTESTPKLTQGG